MKKDNSIDSEITLKNYQRELELCQKLGGDVEKYRRLSFNALQLEQIRLGLEHGVDTESYTDPSLSWMEMERAREMAESGIDMNEYIKQGFNWLQCGEILEGKKQGLDVSFYANTDYFDDQMAEIRKGLERKVDVTFYTNPAYDNFQMREIRKGLELGLDVKKFATTDFPFMTMRALRKGLEKGIDLVEYAKKGYGGKELLELARGLEKKNPHIRKYFEQGYKAEQLAQINYAFEDGVDLLPYLSKRFYGAQLLEIIKGLKKGVDVSIYAKEEYNWFQMREMRYGLEDKVDVTPYANPSFTYYQMAEIRKGILAGVDVSKFAKVYLEPDQMEEMCREMQEGTSEVPEEEIKNIEKKVAAAKIEQPETEHPETEQPGTEQPGTKKKPTKPEEPEAKAILPEAFGGEDDDLDDNEDYDALGVNITEDKMQVYLNLVPKPGRKPYTIFEVSKMLRHCGIKYGVNEIRLKEIVEKGLYNRDILVAEGKPPENGEDGKFTYHFRTEMKKKPKVLENGTVDYKTIDLFEMVNKDQLLAEYTPPTKGVFGYNVTGQIIAPKKGKELPPLHGEGFVMSEDRTQYFAAMDGIVELEDGTKLSVRNMLVIPKDVDTSTGNIHFDGDVNVMGNVTSGFTVEATGNIVIDGRMEGSVVKAGKDVYIRKGCQGQGTGVIEAGGCVTGQFFESVQVTAKEGIEVSYLLNCNVQTDGFLKVQGRRGVIIGGYICARRGIDCFGVGTVAEVKTILEVGIGKTDMSRYNELVKQITKIDAEIETLEKGVVKFMKIQNKDEEMTSFFNRLSKALYAKKMQKKSMDQQKAELTETMSKERGAKIVVSGLVYPGTKLFINTEPYLVREECRNVQFVKQGNTITMDK